MTAVRFVAFGLFSLICLNLGVLYHGGLGGAAPSKVNGAQYQGGGPCYGRAYLSCQDTAVLCADTACVKRTNCPGGAKVVYTNNKYYALREDLQLGKDDASLDTNTAKLCYTTTPCLKGGACVAGLGGGWVCDDGPASGASPLDVADYVLSNVTCYGSD